MIELIISILSEKDLSNYLSYLLPMNYIIYYAILNLSNKYLYL